jgi:hypothetical protein
MQVYRERCRWWFRDLYKLPQFIIFKIIAPSGLAKMWWIHMSIGESTCKFANTSERTYLIILII